MVWGVGVQGTQRRLQGTRGGRGLWEALSCSGLAGCKALYYSGCSGRQCAVLQWTRWAGVHCIVVGGAAVPGTQRPLQGTQPRVQGTQRPLQGTHIFAASLPAIASLLVDGDVLAGLQEGPRAPGVTRATNGGGLVVGSRFLNFPIQNSFAEIGSHRMSSDWRASL